MSTFRTKYSSVRSKPVAVRKEQRKRAEQPRIVLAVGCQVFADLWRIESHRTDLEMSQVSRRKATASHIELRGGSLVYDESFVNLQLFQGWIRPCHGTLHSE
jgi:hypothetical protein